MQTGFLSAVLLLLSLRDDLCFSELLKRGENDDGEGSACGR